MNRFQVLALTVLSLAVGGSFDAAGSQAGAQEAAIAQPSASVSAQTDLGWTSKLGSRGGRLVFVLKDAAGQRIHGATVTASVARRLGACLCRTMVFFEKKPGIYVAPSPLPASGTWDVRVTAVRQGETYETTATITN
jgi:nitrogen fixation protein FixH